MLVSPSTLVEEVIHTQPPPSGEAVVGGGVRLGDLVLGLNEKGRALPHGVCPYVGESKNAVTLEKMRMRQNPYPIVGVGGHAAYGGYGFYSSRSWGVLVDRVVSLEVVTADGNIRIVSEEYDSDLFWALRGAGGSFGIITAFTFRTEATPQNVVVAAYTFNESATVTAGIISAYQNVTQKSAPAEWGSVLNLKRGNQTNFINLILDVTFIGSNATYSKIVSGLLAQLPTPIASSNGVNSTNWIDAAQLLAGSQNLSTHTATDYHDTFYAKSVMVPEAQPLSPAAINAFSTYLGQEGYSSDTAWFVQIELYGGSGSAINNVSRTSTAFVHRDSLFNVQFYASSSDYSPPYPADGIGFVSGMVNSLIDPMGASWPYEAYQNYIDTELTATQAQQLYWVGNYPRLQKIKAKYDPRDIFKLPDYQGILS
ncbi:MAG: hypothetical protein CYPHOPRED_005852 [Cyphobasidiales sp. Tagirdzhanova-0007]|nr:MAG: hypothetical protein CYPHOPRED_005852 [Cyphobasidiales sp. Tagirdzhanova-0007]